MGKSVLSVTASAQSGDVSVSRTLVSELIEKLGEREQLDTVVERDLSSNDIALVTEQHIAAFYTPEADRSAEQKSLLTQSETLVDELLAADTLIIGTPMYNFAVPAVLKAWIDMICRVGRTFQYTENGPEGLSKIETAYIVVATGGAPVRSPVDFVVPYLKQVASFIGVKEVKVIAADKINVDREASIAAARDQIAAL
jgi:FMN-dependent NADH-azoreductase